MAAGDINGGGVPDIVIGVPQHDAGGANSGKVFVFLGESLPVPGTYSPSDADLLFEGVVQSLKLGSVLEVAEDLDGDGYSDLLIGSFTSPENGNNAGSVYVFMGGNLPSTGDVSVLSRDYTILGNQNDQMGYSIDSAGDLNGDGLTDIILGAPYNRESGFGQGTSNGKVTFLMACEQ